MRSTLVDRQRASATGSFQALSVPSGPLQQSELQLEANNAEQVLFTQVSHSTASLPGCLASPSVAESQERRGCAAIACPMQAHILRSIGTALT